jgi:hypothetical protein
MGVAEEGHGCRFFESAVATSFCRRSPNGHNIDPLAALASTTERPVARKAARIRAVPSLTSLLPYRRLLTGFIKMLQVAARDAEIFNPAYVQMPLGTVVAFWLIARVR